MLYDEAAVKANIRNRAGKRIFVLGKHDTLTPSARDYLSRERIAIVPPEEMRKDRWQLLGGGYVEEKPEHMTHLNGEVLVPKTHPRIRFRGAMDTLEAELLLCGSEVALILELASPPYGADMEAATRLGLNISIESGIPGRYAPLEAGAALFEAAQRYLKRQQEGV